MFGQTYYYHLIKSYVIYLGSLFNQIYINRTNANNNNIETMLVPLSYAPKEKFLVRTEGDPKLEKPFAIVLPRMAFELTAMQYDGDRKQPTVNRIYNRKQESDTINYAYVPVPYNLFFSLYLMVKNYEDGAKILEQILPYFTPEMTFSINIMATNTLNKTYDIPVILQSVISEDDFVGPFNQRRMTIWTLNFEMKALFFGPVKQAGLINDIIINLRAPSVDLSEANPNNSPTVTLIEITPGFTANGQATSNSAQSIPISQITSNTNYGYIIDYTDTQD